MKIDAGYLKRFIDTKQLYGLQDEISKAHSKLESGECRGSDFLGWLHLPSSTTEEALGDIEDAASQIRDESDIFIVIGIGGSYLGSRAGIEFLKDRDASEGPEILFAGNSIDPDHLNRIINRVKSKRISINVISKSGTTTEPALAYRIIKNILRKKYPPVELKKRIIFTTTRGRGPLSKEARKEGYRCFYIPPDVGGRFSVLTPVGLLPMAVSGVNIKELIRGAVDRETRSRSHKLSENLSYYYAALRNLMYRNGKRIEIMSSFHTRFFFLLEWWKQLFAESEGKEGKGLFPTMSVFSTDLHAIGQLIQQGERNIFETFLSIEKEDRDLIIPEDKDDMDMLNYLSGKGMDFINRMAYKGTALAHADGGVPNLRISIEERCAYCLGELIYFFQRAVAASGLLLEINPFDQPGVEAYKKNMFKLLGKPH